MADPWEGQRKAAERKAEKDEAARQIVARDARIAAQGVRRNRPKLDKPYPYPKGFYR